MKKLLSGIVLAAAMSFAGVASAQENLSLADMDQVTAGQRGTTIRVVNDFTTNVDANVTSRPRVAGAFAKADATADAVSNNGNGVLAQTFTDGFTFESGRTKEASSTSASISAIGTSRRRH